MDIDTAIEEIHRELIAVVKASGILVDEEARRELRRVGRAIRRLVERAHAAKARGEKGRGVRVAMLAGPPPRAVAFEGPLAPNWQKHGLFVHYPKPPRLPEIMHEDNFVCIAGQGLEQLADVLKTGGDIDKGLRLVTLARLDNLGIGARP